MRALAFAIFGLPGLVAGGLGLAGAGCGDNLSVPPDASTPPPLRPDPAVEQGCAPGPLGAGRTRAKPVACADELVPGALAGGRVGDVVLENTLVRVIIRAAGEGMYLHGGGGGGIVDAASVGGEDLVREVTTAVDLAVIAPEPLVIVEAGDDGAAEVVARGPVQQYDVVAANLGTPAPAVLAETRYRLAADSRAVTVTTRIYRPAGAASGNTIYDVLFFGGRARSFVTGLGFTSGASAVQLLATDGTSSSYGLTYGPERGAMQLVDLAGIRVAAGPTIDDDPAERHFLIGDGSIASVTEAGWAVRGVAVGHVAGTSAPGVDVMAFSPDGAGVTVARADAAGRFVLAAPPGPITLRAESPGRDPGASVAVTVNAGVEARVDVPAGPGGTITVAARDDADQPIPARVALERGAERRLTWTGADGALVAPVPPGTWRVTVSRGLEYDAFVATAVEVTDGQTQALTARLTRVVDTTGWISVDTHLHSEVSIDSTIPVDDRVRAVAGEGVEVAVATDHDVITSYAPTVARLGLRDFVVPVEGAEVSSRAYGHINGFPLRPALDRTGRGAPRWWQRAPAGVFAALRAAGDGDVVVQVNHPRRGGSGMFGALQLDAATLTVGAVPADLGLPDGTDLTSLAFDAVEVANSKAGSDLEDTFRDWLAMVAAGHPAAATGSSDSHGATAYAGKARTLVWVGAGADDPAQLDVAALGVALRARRAVVSTGAFITAEVVGQAGPIGIGESGPVAQGAPVTLRVRVQAPPWQPLASLTIYQGTSVVRTLALDPLETQPMRFSADVVVPAPPGPTFYVVRVDLAAVGTPVLDSTQPSFTNPMFVVPGAARAGAGRGPGPSPTR